MKQKGINSEKIFINKVLQKLEDLNPIPDNKIIFIEALIKLFNIEDIDSKSLIMDMANKEFVDNKTLKERIYNEISIFETLFNKNNKILKNSEELKQFFYSNENVMNKMKNLFEKYDKNKKGFITFNEMKEIIKEIQLENIKEEILLLFKSEIFNRMDYFKLVLLSKEPNSCQIIKDNNQKLNDKFKYFIHSIKKENNSLNTILSYMKENITIANKTIKNEYEQLNVEIISIDNFVKILGIKNIEFDQKDIELIKEIYGVAEINQIENKKYEKYIDYKKIVNKFKEIIQNEKIQ